MRRLLLIEDDFDLGSTLKEQLEEQGYQVQWCQSIEDFAKIKASDFEIAVVDLNLPDGSGFQIIKSLTIPVVVMTALNTPENRLKSLELGAIDFIPKPFLFKELNIKIDRLLSSGKEKVQVLGRTVDFLARTIQTANGDVVFLNDREFSTLKLLYDRAPEAVSRDDILDFVSRQDEVASHRSIDNSIVKIRQYLGDEDHQIIKSIRGVGYQWIGDRYE